MHCARIAQPPKPYILHCTGIALIAQGLEVIYPVIRGFAQAICSGPDCFESDSNCIVHTQAGQQNVEMTAIIYTGIPHLQGQPTAFVV